MKGDKPKDNRKSATEIERQFREKKTKKLVLEKAKKIQTQKDLKDKKAKRLALVKAQIEVLLEKHRPCTPKTPDEVNTLGTGKNACRWLRRDQKGKTPTQKHNKR